jgi:archaellum component FlaD/FlaE
MVDEIKDYHLKINFPKVTTAQDYRPAESEEKGAEVQSQVQMISKNEYRVDIKVLKDFEKRLEKLENFEVNVKIAIQEIKESIAKLEALRAELDDMRRGYVNVERTLYELAALYDLVSSHLNPFVDSSEEQRSIGTKIVEHIGEPESIEEIDYTSINISKWGRFLLDRLPKDKIPSLLDHYMKIGWLDDDIKNKIESYIENVSEVSGIKVRRYDNIDTDDWWKLSVDDHVKSLQYIEKIREDRTKTRIKKMRK